ncbi:MAG: hypothetical protein AAGC93_09015 [Cyanobacteria bacterium P01_F01_bin.53]
MPGEDRLTALIAQEETATGAVVTGIDFIQVVDPADQTLLRVFFIINPDELSDPIVETANLPLTVPPATVEIVSISGGERLASVPVIAATYRQQLFNNQPRTFLDVETAEPGDFSIYRLTIRSAANLTATEPRIDRFFNGVEFSFKQGCPSVLDCKPPDPECPPEALVDFPVDYLARDFVSIRNALLDFATQRYPQWTEKIEADAGVMLAEIMAALGDEFSYIQDRYAREVYLESATQRRSIRHHASLIDYPIDNGLSASTFLDLTVSETANGGSGGLFVAAGSLVWAPSQGEAPIPFELGRGLADSVANEGEPEQFWVHFDWNTMPAHNPDESKPCLPIGSTELFLRGNFPTGIQLPTLPNNDAQLLQFWVGRGMLLQTTPEDPSLPARRHLIRIVEVEQTIDPLCLDTGDQPDADDQPIEITRIRWEEAQATPFELCLKDLVVRGNIVFSTAGETIREYFTTRPAEPFDGELFPAPVQVAIERQGPLDEVKCQRSVSYRYSLRQAETRGLGWLTTDTSPFPGIGPSTQPEIELQEVDPVTLDPLAIADSWKWEPSLIGSTRFQDHFTLEEGTWRRVISFRRIGETITHEDYASGDGFTIRFGDGEFGRIPDEETIFQVRYRTGPGQRANLPADTITQLMNPVDSTPSVLAGDILAVTNPFPITNGRDPESVESIKQMAPEAFRALTFRAVRPEDYAEIAERLPWVQRAGARFRCTGSWLSAFVTADPLNAFELSAPRRRELTNLMDCVRQVGREVFVRNPRYVNLDLEICFCVEPFAYPGQVQARVKEALLGRSGIRPMKGFFHPDNFTFGTPLKRSALEAAVQSVEGVLGVEQIRIRARGITDWRIFEELLFTVAADRIIRLRNNPRFPEQGSLRLVARQGQVSAVKEEIS